jgi:putative aldouronate transport system permease protein
MAGVQAVMPLVRKSGAERAFDVSAAVILVILSLFFLAPMVIVLTHSFLSPEEISRRGTFILIPQRFDTAAYRMILSKTSSIYRAYGVTIMRVLAGTATQLLFTCTMAYSLSKNYLPGRKAVIALINVAIVFPAPLVPLFLLVRGAGLYGSFWSMIIPFAINSVYIFIMKAFYQQLPADIEEAALIDGCGQTKMLTKIVLPLSKASIATVGMMYAVWHWNEWFYSSLFIVENARMPLQNIMQGIILNASGSDLIAGPESMPAAETVKCAVIVVSVAPVICLFPFLQKHFAKGFLVGGVKG